MASGIGQNKLRVAPQNLFLFKQFLSFLLCALCVLCGKLINKITTESTKKEAKKRLSQAYLTVRLYFDKIQKYLPE